TTRSNCSWTWAAAPVASTGVRFAPRAPSSSPPPPPLHPATRSSAADAAQILALAFRFTFHLRRDFFPMFAEQAWDRSRLRHAPGRILECGVRAAAYRIAACCDHRPSVRAEETAEKKETGEGGDRVRQRGPRHAPPLPAPADPPAAGPRVRADRAARGHGRRGRRAGARLPGPPQHGTRAAADGELGPLGLRTRPAPLRADPGGPRPTGGADAVRGHGFRAHRSMERGRLLTPSWVPSGSGPARRRYELAPEGVAGLRARMSGLARCGPVLASFLVLWKEHSELSRR